MTELIQIADDQGTPTSIVRLIAKGDTGLLPLFTYLVAESPPDTFFLQISAANRNLSRFSPHPLDTITLAQMLSLLEDKGYEKDAIVANITYYEAKIEALITGDTVETPYVRPTTGSLHRLADSTEITRSLSLPQAADHHTRIGVLARSGDTEVAIHVNKQKLDHHFLVAGATGSGKSHLLSNLAHCAAALDRCVILFDHKPDHQNHHEVNTDPNTQHPRAFTLNATNSQGVRYWTLDDQDRNTNALVVGARSSELDPAILSSTVFHRGGEELQAETFEHIASAFSDDQADGEWTIHDLVTYIRQTTDGALSKRLYGDSGGKVHGATMQAIRRKLNMPGRIPPFLDRRPRPGLVGKRKSAGDINDLFQPGLNVLRISDSNARGYALFLDQLLSRAASLRSEATLSASSDAPEIEMIIDEASDIFQAESRRLREAASGMLAEQIRKGRSLHIGYVISVQSAGDVPDRIRNNLNTTIIGRHRNMNVLREALPTAQPQMLEQADRLAPGEMYVDMFGVRSLLLSQMDLSPSMLTVVE